MKKLCTLAALSLALAPCGVLAQSTGAVPMMGDGVHGYDFLVGSWACNNSKPSAMSGPATGTLTVTRAAAHNAIVVHYTGTGADGYAFISYNPKTKVWSSPGSSADGSYSVETTTDTGHKVVWTGTALDASSGKTMQVRDTYTITSADKYTDLSELNTGDGWKSLATFACTKS